MNESKQSDKIYFLCKNALLSSDRTKKNLMLFGVILWRRGLPFLFFFRAFPSTLSSLSCLVERKLFLVGNCYNNYYYIIIIIELLWI